MADPISVERLIDHKGEATFQVTWKEDDKILRSKECFDLPAAIMNAANWRTERKMFGVPDLPVPGTEDEK